MKNLFLTLSISLMSLSAFAQDSDLVLPGAKWVASYKNNICVAFGAPVAFPSEIAALNLSFERLVTDSTLDNGLITANFTVDGKACRYSAILLADNAASTIRLVESKAIAKTEDANCAEGQSVIDAALESNDYLYWGHPHNLTIMIPSANASEVCGASATHVGFNFVVSGKLPTPAK